MYTCCSYCKTLFRINAQQLAAARGRVRCGVCRNAFSALDSLTEQPDGLSVTHRPTDEIRTNADIWGVETAERVAAVTTMDAMEPPVPFSRHAVNSDAVLRTSEGVSADEFDLINAAPIVTEDRLDPVTVRPKRISLSATLAWSTINLGLIALLATQFVYFNRYDLAQYVELRPALEEMCQYAGCDIPPQRDVTKITLMNRELRSHPDAANALLVTATLVNGASFRQPYPLLQLNLSDFSGRTVAMRHFLPAEYMSKSMDIQSGMLPGQPVEVSLELADPGKAAVGFEFNFI